MNEYIAIGKQVVTIIKENGFSAYFVGGFVRDKMLGIDSNDIDITTNALPDDIMKIFPKTYKTGVKYGTITVIHNRHQFEVTTYRKDVSYKDHRRPEVVAFSNDVYEDIERRDFTINAMLMDEHGKIIDYVNGKEAILHRQIVCIGDATKRFHEDALRILRAIRFAAKLNFYIEKNTLIAIKQNKDLLLHVSKERVLAELKKTFSYDYSIVGCAYLVETEIHKLFQGMEKGLEYLGSNNTTLNELESFALCFYLSNEEISSFWRFSNKELEILKKVINLVGAVHEEGYNKLHIYSNTKDVCLMANNVAVALGKTDYSKNIVALAKEIPITKVCDLKFKGGDIIKITGMKPASWLGELVDDIKFQVVMGLLPNDYQVLKEYTLGKINELEKKDTL